MPRTVSLGLVTAACALLAATACADRPRRVFRAGAYAVEITPREFPVTVNGSFFPRTATRANDPLHARCLVLDDGSERVAITVVDSLMLPRELLDQAKETASAVTGIPTDRMLISATHTHWAPAVRGGLGTDPDPDYPRFLPGQLVRVIEGAVKNLAQARIGWAVVPDPEHTHCRRWILRPDRIMEDPFGQPTVRANMHPGYQNPDFVGPAGPVDPDLSILSVQSTDGQPVALLANYSMHYVGLDAKDVVSAGYFGVFAEKIRQRIGAEGLEPPFVGIISQGTSGDLHWMDYSKPRQDRDMYRFAEGIAAVAHAAYQNIEYRDWVPLAMAETKLSLSRRMLSEQRLSWARKTVAGMEGRPPKTRPEIYAREQLLIIEEPVRELKLQALRIGDLGITAIPNEVFGITGLKIKAQSPLQPTINIELANGAEGYIPPPEQHLLGGYTTWEARSANLETGAEPKIVNALLELLEEVSGKPRRRVADAHGPYPTVVLESRPVAYWRLNEIHGPRAVDQTGHNNHAEYDGGVAFYLEGPASGGLSGETQINRAPHLAGGRLKASIESLGNQYSVELWFWNGMPVDARAVTGYLLALGQDRLGIGGHGAAKGRLFFSGRGAPKELLEGIAPIGLKTWHFVVLVRDGNRVTVYLDGNSVPEISAQTPAGAPLASAQVFLGGRSDGVASLEGKIDEVAIYDRALPAREIALHYAASGFASARSREPGGKK